MNIIKDSFKVIIISSVISLSALFVFAQTGWFEPSVEPPGGNRPAPLTLDSQGGLTIPGNLKIDGGLNFQGSSINIVYANTGEDSYTNYQCLYCRMWDPGTEGTSPELVDSCWNIYSKPRYVGTFSSLDLDCNSNKEDAYSCPADVTKSCKDAYRDKACDYYSWGYGGTGYRTRDVNCVGKGLLTVQ